MKNKTIEPMLNTNTIAASAKLSASAGIYTKPTASKAEYLNGLGVNANSETALPISSIHNCLNNHTLFKSETLGQQDTFLNDKLLHQIGTNLVDLSVCWHKMSLPDKCDASDELIAKIDPVKESVDATIRTDELTKKNFQQEFSSLIIKTTYERTGFDASQILNSNDQSFGKINEQLQFITIQSPSLLNSSNKTLIEQINVFNKYNQSKFNELKYKLVNDDLGIEIIGYVKIHWNLKKPIKLSDRSIEMNELNENDSSYSSFKATSVRDLKKKRQQISFDDTFSKVSAKVSENFFRNQTVKVKSMSKSSKRSSILQDDLEEEENATRDEMFLPSYGSASNICVDNKTTCWKAIKILLEKFHIESSPDGYSLYKVYQSGEIRELNSGDFPLIQRLYMGPFNEDKIFIMEKGRTVSVDQDVMNLVTLPKALLKALIESSKKEESKEISEFKQKYKTYRDILNYRLKSLK